MILNTDVRVFALKIGKAVLIVVGVNCLFAVYGKELFS